MRLENAYRVELHVRGAKTLVQYIEARNVDEARRLAARTFYARLHGYERPSSSSTQKACPVSKLTGKMTFGFLGGWVTLNCDGLTIFEAQAKAEAHEFADGPVIEITTAVGDMMTVAA